MNNYYLCIDLKTFYASVECVERGLDPFKTDLIVADIARSKGAICLAISPKMIVIVVLLKMKKSFINVMIRFMTKCIMKK